MADLSARVQAAIGRRYAIEREIGHGGMATVYLAEDRKHGRPVAIKVLAPEVALALGPERFLREIDVLARLNHPSILPLHDSGHASGLLFYVMPYVEGESLRERLRREGRLAVEEARRIASEVADALSYAHGMGVVHRDIKPENILLSGGHARLADFGIAQVIVTGPAERLTDVGLPIGTTVYMSPEQAAGTANVDGRSDVYGLGCVLFEMLAGCPPFTGPTAQAIHSERLLRPPPLLRSLRDEIPEWLEEVVACALSGSPDDRFPTAASFRESLAGPIGPPSRVSALIRLRRPARPRRAGWPRALASQAVLGALAIATVAGGVALFAGRPPALEPRRVLVAPVVNETGDTSLDALALAAADHLTGGLAEIGLVQVLDARDEVGRDSALALAGTTGVRDLARRLGAGTILAGSLRLRGDSLAFEPRMLDPRTGELARTLQLVAVPVGERRRGLELLRQRAMGAVAALFDPRFVSYEAASLPPTYEAYEEFLTANEMFFETFCDGCAVEAVDHIRRAIAIDPTWTAAWTTLAAMHVLLGDCAAADSIAARLEPIRYRLPPYDRAQIETSGAACRGDWEAALEANRRAMSAEPHHAGRTKWVPLFALLLNRPREVLAVLDSIDPSRGDPHGVRDYWWYVAEAHHLLGEHGEELAAARMARRDGENKAYGLQIETVALAALGRVEDVTARIDERLAMPAVDRWPADAPGELMVRAGLELRAHGKPEAARPFFERAIEWYGASPFDPTPDREHRLSVGRALYFAGRWDEARTAFEELAETDRDDPVPRAMLGAIAARGGAVQEAHRHDAWLAARHSSVRAAGRDWGSIPYLRASIAALLGERERAVDLLRRALREGFPFVTPDRNPWLEVNPDFEILRGYPPFEDLLRPKG